MKEVKAESYDDLIHRLIGGHYEVKSFRKKTGRTETMELGKELREGNLEDQYPCATRFQHNGVYYCHAKGQGMIKKLLSLKICGCCKDRLDQEAFIQRQQERAGS